MSNRSTVFTLASPIALAMLGCSGPATEPPSPEPSASKPSSTLATPGVYRYVLGVDADGNTKTGAAHALVGPATWGKADAIDGHNQPEQSAPRGSGSPSSRSTTPDPRPR